MLFSRVRGLPVLTPGGDGRVGVVRSLSVDGAPWRVTHVVVARGRLHRSARVAWDALRAAGPGTLVVRGTGGRSGGGPGKVTDHHELVGSRVLTECGEERGTVLDAAFDPVDGRIEAVLTTAGEVPPDRLLGLGDHALVTRADHARHDIRAA
ncbi:PRC-barrel domain containing protein [Streptomyces sp. CHD11]|uniref:PRC-barrel domain-containing protein n=1 Tax=Streptomyces sp. CHD11 TaxID=2741325 RepID=UPI001BFC61E1|nr:PRC-barrel domain-containing protein [Streptomyces sp. CHD11]MBT3155126.1 PRC-barrel domain containing protein [Streptomyces sp. CHD11]